MSKFVGYNACILYFMWILCRFLARASIVAVLIRVESSWLVVVSMAPSSFINIRHHVIGSVMYQCNGVFSVDSFHYGSCRSSNECNVEENGTDDR